MDVLPEGVALELPSDERELAAVVRLLNANQADSFILLEWLQREQARQDERNVITDGLQSIGRGQGASAVLRAMTALVVDGPDMLQKMRRSATHRD